LVDGCVTCAYLFFCGGGCEAFAFQRTGALDRANCNDFPKVFQKAAVLAYDDFIQSREQAVHFEPSAGMKTELI